MAINKISNEYARAFGDLYERTPKAVFAAIAFSALTCGGDNWDGGQAALLKEWRTLHANGIVPQAPPGEALAGETGRRDTMADDLERGS
jgi:hypothetical protein